MGHVDAVAFADRAVDGRRPALLCRLLASTRPGQGLGFEIPLKREPAFVDWLVAELAKGRKLLIFGDLPLRTARERQRLLDPHLLAPLQGASFLISYPGGVARHRGLNPRLQAKIPPESGCNDRAHEDNAVAGIPSGSACPTEEFSNDRAREGNGIARFIDHPGGMSAGSRRSQTSGLRDDNNSHPGGVAEEGGAKRRTPFRNVEPTYLFISA